MLVLAAATEPGTKSKQTDREDWFCAGDCSGTHGADCGKKNVAQSAQYNGK